MRAPHTGSVVHVPRDASGSHVEGWTHEGAGLNCYWRKSILGHSGGQGTAQLFEGYEMGLDPGSAMVPLNSGHEELHHRRILCVWESDARGVFHIG